MKTLRQAQADCARLLYVFANLSLAAIRKTLWPAERPQQARRVCIYRIGNIGDIVVALPAMYAIRQAYPNAHLTLLTSPGRRTAIGAAELLEGAGWLDEVFVYYTDDIATLRQCVKLLSQLRERSYDVWIELPRSLAYIGTMLRNMLAARLVGPRWGYGWRVSTIRWAAQAQSEFLTFPNEVERLLAVVSDSGIQSGEPVFPLPLGNSHSRAIDDLLSRKGFTGEKLAAIAPGAKRSTNRWPLDRFAQVGRHLVSKGFAVLVLGGASDGEICRDVATAVGSRALNAAGQLSLLESCELLRRCHLLICNDSGVQHLAAAVGTPCISLFSFWQLRGKWRPYGPGNVVLQKWVECHTCFLDLCPYDNRCIKLIETDEVIAVADRTLAGAQSKPMTENANGVCSVVSQ